MLRQSKWSSEREIVELCIRCCQEIFTSNQLAPILWGASPSSLALSPVWISWASHMLPHKNTSTGNFSNTQKLLKHPHDLRVCWYRWPVIDPKGKGWKSLKTCLVFKIPTTNPPLLVGALCSNVWFEYWLKSQKGSQQKVLPWACLCDILLLPCEYLNVA